MNITSVDDLISQIFDLYTEAREFSFEDKSGRIERGRNHPVSSKAEDLLALVLMNNLSKKFTYKVDQPITVGNQTIYPDITIMKKNEVINFVDLKLDIGWKRNDFSHFLEEIDERTKKYQGMSARMKNGKTKEIETIKISETCKNHIVIISGTNIKKERLLSHVNAAKKLKNTITYILSHDVHPNTYKWSLDDIRVDKKEFKYLLNNLKA
jgi:hypothetical protein